MNEVTKPTMKARRATNFAAGDSSSSFRTGVGILVTCYQSINVTATHLCHSDCSLARFFLNLPWVALYLAIYLTWINAILSIRTIHCFLNCEIDIVVVHATNRCVSQSIYVYTTYANRHTISHVAKLSRVTWEVCSGSGGGRSDSRRGVDKWTGAWADSVTGMLLKDNLRV